MFVNVCRKMQVCDVAEFITQSDNVSGICVTTHQADR